MKKEESLLKEEIVKLNDDEYMQSWLGKSIFYLMIMKLFLHFLKQGKAGKWKSHLIKGHIALFFTYSV